VERDLRVRLSAQRGDPGQGLASFDFSGTAPCSRHKKAAPKAGGLEIRENETD
jgi:hypothetical protein